MNLVILYIRSDFMKKNKSRLLTLFLNTLYISTFTFGGGFVIISLMKKKFVDRLHWISEEEMLDMASIAQSSPGAIAVNAAILVGRKINGFIGMIVAVLGTIIPPIAIITAISFFYEAFADNRYVAIVLRGMQLGAAAVIFDVIYTLAKNVLKKKDAVYISVMLLAFIAAFFLNVNVIIIIAAAAVTGVLYCLIRKRRGERK